MNLNSTRETTVVFKSEEAARKLFAHLSEWDNIQQSGCEVKIVSNRGISVEIRDAVCSSEVDSFDQLLCINVKRLGEKEYKIPS